MNHSVTSWPEVDQYHQSSIDEWCSRWKRKEKVFVNKGSQVARSVAYSGRHRSSSSTAATTPTVGHTMTMIKFISILLLAILVVLNTLPNGAQAIKLPSFFSWIQPQQQQTVLQMPQGHGNTQVVMTTGSQQLIHSSQLSSGANNMVLSGSPVKLQQSAAAVADEPILASASVFEPAKQQQQVSSLRKPFQSILMLPSKHNQMNLFSSLPKSIFGRFLSSAGTGQSNSGTPTSGLTSIPSLGQWSVSYPLSSIYPAGPSFAPVATVSEEQAQPQAQQQQQQQRSRYPTQQFGTMHTFNQNRHHQRLRQPPNLQLNGEQPKKHALGFGENDDFMIVDSHDPTTMDHMEHPYEQGAPSFNHHHKQQVVGSQVTTSQREQSGQLPADEYQEMPAIVISDPDATSVGAEQFEQQHTTNNTSRPQPQQQQNGSGEHELTSLKNVTSLEVSESMRAQSNLTNVERDSIALNRSVQNGNSTATGESTTQTTSGGTASTVPDSTAAAAGSNQSAESTINQNQANNVTEPISGSPGDQVGSSSTTINSNATHGNVLATLINDELMKLKQVAPETLNKTLGSIGQPLVELFMDSAEQQLNRQRQEDGRHHSKMMMINNTTTNMRSQVAESQQQVFVGGGQPLNTNVHLDSSNGNPESGGMESSAAAIIVSPTSEITATSTQQQQLDSQSTNQVASMANGNNDEQIESFIIGPYKGLTSDNLPTNGQQQLISEQMNQFRAAASSADQQQVSMTMPMMAIPMNLQQQQQQSQSQSQSQVGVGMGIMASNLIQQAKSLIHLPFVHMTSAPGQGNLFRGQPTAPAATSNHLSRPREYLLEESSSPSPYTHASNRQHHHPSMMTMLRHHQGTGNYHQLQQHHTAAFYNNNNNRPAVVQQVTMPMQQSVAWPPRQQQQQNQQLVAGSNNRSPPHSATNLKPVHEPFQVHPHPYPQQLAAAQEIEMLTDQPQVAAHQQHAGSNRYFHMATSMPMSRHRPYQQQDKQLMSQPGATASNNRQQQQQFSPDVPYFVESPQPVNHEQPQHVSPQNQLFVHQTQQQQSSSDNNFSRYSQQPTGSQSAVSPLSPSVAVKSSVPESQRLNNLANQQQQLPHQTSGFHLVVDHVTSSQPSAYFEQQQNGGELRQQQLAATATTAAAPGQVLSAGQPRKFKSGLYQIDPPKLVADQLEGAFADQQPVAVPDSEADPELQQQIAASAADQQQQIKQQDEDDDDDDVEQSATESPESESTSDQEFARQVGASIGVGLGASGAAVNKTLKGQVFNEPISSVVTTSPPAASPKGEKASVSRQPQTDGQSLSQMKTLKLTQDVTLYDFEVPAQRQQQLAGNNQVSLAAHNSVPDQSASNNAINFLDTQVYTVPYTITMQPNGRAQFSAPNAHASNANYQTTANFQQQRQPLQQQTSPFRQLNKQLDGFRLPYMAPPGAPPAQHHQNLLTRPPPIRPSQSQPKPSYQPYRQHQQPNSRIPDYGAQQSLFRSIFQDLNSQQSDVPQNIVEWGPQQSTASAITIQTVDDNSVQEHSNRPPQMSFEDVKFADQITNSIKPGRQHYFHYQPVATLNQQQQQPLRQPAQVSFQEQRAPQMADEPPKQQQQYLLAIHHNGNSVAPNGASIFSSSFMSPPLPVQPQQIQQPIKSQLLEPIVGGSNAENSTKETPVRVLDVTSQKTPNQLEDSTDSAILGQSSSSTNSNSAESRLRDQDEDDDDDNDNINDTNNSQQMDRKETKQEQQQTQQQLAPNNPQVPNSPSAFCADRAPGLYADETQRCKAYYQCAPTGHQMFRCNNQTQFNQKTQNCDWWYNVNCGGRLGSPSDFDQAIITTTSEAPQQQQRPSFQSADNRDSTATSGGDDRDSLSSSSSSIGQGLSTSSQDMLQQQSDTQQVAPLSVSTANDDQRVLKGGVADEQQPTRVNANRWSSADALKMARQQLVSEQQHPQQDDQEPAELFHHSESQTSSTVAPEQQQQQLQEQEQQLAPTSSTPTYRQQSVGGSLQTTMTGEKISQQQQLLAGQQEFADRSGQSTSTQDPLFSSPSSTTESSVARDGSLNPEAQPQVGANLTSDDLVPSSTSAAPSGNEAFTPVTATATSSTISDSTTSIQSSLSPSTTSEPPTIIIDTSVNSELPNERQTGGQQVADSISAPELTNKNKRLVQSEFGLGVQHQQAASFKEGAKMARSAARFEFTRTGPQASKQARDQLFSGNLVSVKTDTSGGEPQYANHKYSVGEQQSESPIYSTSANQGSVSYIPLEAHYLNAKTGQQQQQSSDQEVASGRRIDRRFGARLISGGGQQQAFTARQATTTTELTTTLASNSRLDKAREQQR